jgi:carboxyl-terminal processing protease
MKQLIFDLRNNGGGLLDQAIEIGDQFVPDGAAVVETRGRTPDSMQSYRATGRYPSLSMPVVVLVNRGTASAAEIVSGAIQDHDMGLILGTPTWGKGLVQTVFNLPYGAGLALTTAKYYTPAGRLIQRDYTSYYDYVNVGDGVDEAPAHSANDPVFRTDLGREVFGGGGVTPDVLVENELLKPFSQMLLSKNCFLNFAVDYIAKNEVPNRDWRPGPELLDLFRAWLIAENIAPESEVTSGLADAPTASYVVLAATGEVMNARFGQEAQHRVVSQGDQQIQRALALFPQASELLAQRLASKGDAKVRESVERP